MAYFVTSEILSDTLVPMKCGAATKQISVKHKKLYHQSIIALRDTSLGSCLPCWGTIAPLYMIFSEYKYILWPKGHYILYMGERGVTIEPKY